MEQTKEKRVMDEKTRRELAGHLGFSNDSTIDLPPEEYLEKDKDGELDVPEDLIGYFPTYTVRSFTKAEKTAYDAIIKESIADTERKNTKEINAKLENLIRSCIMNVKNNFDMGTLQIVPYKPDPSGGMDVDQFDKIKSAYISSISSFILKLSLLLPGEKLSLK
jgi:hypothetical protein